jgi:hypothetical protein
MKWLPIMIVMIFCLFVALVFIIPAKATEHCSKTPELLFENLDRMAAKFNKPYLAKRFLSDDGQMELILIYQHRRKTGWIFWHVKGCGTDWFNLLIEAVYETFGREKIILFNNQEKT